MMEHDSLVITDDVVVPNKLRSSTGSFDKDAVW